MKNLWHGLSGAAALGVSPRPSGLVWAWMWLAFEAVAAPFAAACASNSTVPSASLNGSWPETDPV